MSMERWPSRAAIASRLMPAVDGLGGEGVAQLVGVDVADAGPLGDAADVAVDGAPVEGLAVVAFDEAPGA